MLRALWNPVGVALLAVSVVLAAAMWLLSGLQQWSDRVVWSLVAGIGAYSASVVTVTRMARPRSEPPTPGPTQPTPSARPVPPTPPEPALSTPVETALRNLNRPALLSRCELAGRIPLLVAAAAAKLGVANPSGGAVSNTQALRAVLVAAIERLKPAAGPMPPGTPAMLQFQILFEAYVNGRTNNSIVARLGLPERTFYTYRREAIDAVVRDLEAQEDEMAAGARRPEPRGEAGSV